MDISLDEQEEKEKYKALYNPRYMIARVLTDEPYKSNEGDAQDSINDVLPSVKEKALIKQQEKFYTKLKNKNFQINYTFDEKKAVKKMENN